MRKLNEILLKTGQRAFIPKRGHGMIYYPSLPQPLQGTKQACRPDFDITHPDDWPEWVQNMHSEHLAVEVTRDGYLIFWGGTIHDGIFCGDEKTIYMGGCFRDGIVIGGEFYNCHWISGEKRGGNFHSGTWRGGIHRAGYFGGLWLGGSWMGGEFNGYRERSRVAPPLYMDSQGMWPV
jgi:hypothetical protein